VTASLLFRKFSTARRAPARPWLPEPFRKLFLHRTVGCFASCERTSRPVNEGLFVHRASVASLLDPSENPSRAVEIATVRNDRRASIEAIAQMDCLRHVIVGRGPRAYDHSLSRRRQNTPPAQASITNSCVPVRVLALGELPVLLRGPSRLLGASRWSKSCAGLHSIRRAIHRKSLSQRVPMITCLPLSASFVVGPLPLGLVARRCPCHCRVSPAIGDAHECDGKRPARRWLHRHASGVIWRARALRPRTRVRRRGVPRGRTQRAEVGPPFTAVALIAYA